VEEETPAGDTVVLVTVPQGKTMPAGNSGQYIRSYEDE